MDEKWIILILVGMAHLNLAMSFVPGYWEPLKRNGRRFTTLVGPLAMPVLVALMLALVLFDDWSVLPSWSRFVGPLGIGACSATLIINLKVLKNLESRHLA